MSEMQPYDTEGTLRATADKLKALLDSLELSENGQHGSVIRDVARISGALTATCAELRQAEKARVREVSKIPLETVIDHLKTLPDDKRERVIAALSGVDEETSLL